MPSGRRAVDRSPARPGRRRERGACRRRRAWRRRLEDQPHAAQEGQLRKPGSVKSPRPWTGSRRAGRRIPRARRGSRRDARKNKDRDPGVGGKHLVFRHIAMSAAAQRKSRPPCGNNPASAKPLPSARRAPWRRTRALRRRWPRGHKDHRAPVEDTSASKGETHGFLGRMTLPADSMSDASSFRGPLRRGRRHLRHPSSSTDGKLRQGRGKGDRAERGESKPNRRTITRSDPPDGSRSILQCRHGQAVGAHPTAP